MVKCFDIVSLLIEEANKKFSPIWIPNLDDYDILKQYCSVIDCLSKEFNGESYDVEIDEIKMTISITLECWDMAYTSSDHLFFKLAQRALSLEFSVSENENLNVKFIFPSIWEKA